MELYKPPRLTGKYLDKVLASRWLTAGPMCERFREAVAEKLKVGPDRIALAARATSGFQAVLDMICYHDALGEEPEDYPTIDCTHATFVGIRHAISHAGMCTGWDRDWRSRPDIVVKTDIGGRRLAIEDEDMSSRYFVANRLPYPKWYIHDACHSWLPDPAADFAVLSCYPTKPVPGAEGGVVVCKDPEHAREIESWCSSGLSPAFNPTRLGGTEPSVPGRETHLTDVAAALNLEALEVSDRYMAGIRLSWQKLARAGQNWEVPFRCQPLVPYLFQVEVRDVAEVRAELAKWGVPTAWNFPPAPLVTLPCRPDMGIREAELIIKFTRRAIEAVESRRVAN